MAYVTNERVQQIFKEALDAPIVPEGPDTTSIVFDAMLKLRDECCGEIHSHTHIFRAFLNLPGAKIPWCKECDKIWIEGHVS